MLTFGVFMLKRKYTLHMYSETYIRPDTLTFVGFVSVRIFELSGCIRVQHIGGSLY